MSNIKLKGTKWFVSGARHGIKFNSNGREIQLEFKDGLFSMFTIAAPAKDCECTDYGKYEIIQDEKLILEFTKDRDGFNERHELIILSFTPNKMRVQDYQYAADPIPEFDLTLMENS